MKKHNLTFRDPMPLRLTQSTALGETECEPVRFYAMRQFSAYDGHDGYLVAGRTKPEWELDENGWWLRLPNGELADCGDEIYGHEIVYVIDVTLPLVMFGDVEDDIILAVREAAGK